MTIITIINSAYEADITEQLLRYEFELLTRHLSMKCIGADDDRIHLEIPTRTWREHEIVMRLAKEIFRTALFD